MMTKSLSVCSTGSGIGITTKIVHGRYVCYEVSSADDDKEPLRLQHWQWNWNSYKDSSWPLRLLRRSRTSDTPTVVHCIDGCGRTGTLVTLEAVMCQILRGSVNVDHIVLSSCLFVRLQRKHAVRNYKQYLYIYRCVLNWMKPYLRSQYDLMSLGLLFPSVGFVSAYNMLVDGSD
uniref:Protein-tyrosine phosphatase n=1 Tax=Steinernema glaseri TaxID=37863 RepID=A0A1I7YZ21_9BILA